MSSTFSLKNGAKIAVAFVGGVFVGGAGSFLWISQSIATAQELFSLATRANLQEEAFTQYKTGDLRVAVYALTRALNAQEEPSRAINTQRGGAWDVGLLNARLAKINSQLGNAEQTKHHVQRAIVAFAQSGWRLRDATELWSALELIDDNKVKQAVERYGAKD